MIADSDDTEAAISNFALRQKCDPQTTTVKTEDL